MDETKKPNPIDPSHLRLRFKNNLETLRETVKLFPPGRDTACVITKIDEVELWASRALPKSEAKAPTNIGAPDDPKARWA